MEIERRKKPVRSPHSSTTNQLPGRATLNKSNLHDLYMLPSTVTTFLNSRIQISQHRKAITQPMHPQ